MTMTLRPSTTRLAALSLVAAIFPLTAAAAPASHPSVSGAGSSWSAAAINQWAHDVQPSGIVANYNPTGSDAGRLGFIQDQYDFAASDVPFRNGQDQLGGTGREVVPWGFSYIPLTATGISFIYHLSIHGHPVTNLRLSGQTLMEIFTGQIINWDNPQITRDYGHPLPNLPITPVIHSDGAGTTYYFSRWMAHVFPHQWNAFCQKVHPGIKLPCGQTEFYPPFGSAVSENGSSNVASYVSTTYGAIGYVEYAYALISRLPVLELENPAGDFVRPLPGNVTTALMHALIVTNPHSPEFLQEDLNPLYTSKDPGNYPLSYYSYWIVPRTHTKIPPIFTSPPGKGRTLSLFIEYALCAGQRQMTRLGYAPLPVNLVNGGLDQVKKIPGHGPIAGCADQS